MLRRRAETVEQIAGGNILKQGDEATLVFQFRNELGALMDIQGSTVNVKIANKRAVVLEKTATVNLNNTIDVPLTKDDVTGWGDMRIEFKITLPNGKIRKFPQDGWYKIEITPTLDDLGFGEIVYITLEKLLEELEEFKDGIVGSGQYAREQGDYAKEQGDYAKQQGDLLAERLQNKEDYGTAPPTTGAWVVGNKRWKTNAVPGGYLGWICVQSGEFGTASEPAFRQFGVISE